MARNVSGAGAVFLLGGLLAVGCSHAWDALEPLGGAGGGTSATGTGGSGGDPTGATSSASGTTSSTGGASGTTSSSSAASSSAASSSAASSSAASSSAASSSAASSSAASTTGGGGSTAFYAATFAACNSDMDLDPTACELIVGKAAMTIDAMTDTNTITRGFVRFDLDSTLVGKTVDSVTLRLTTLPADTADSNSSGRIWKVTPFSSVTLPMAQPTPIGAPIGLNLGPVALATDYYWGLPNGLVAPSAPVFLGIDTTSTNGVRYWNDHGAVPPILIVVYH
jgi:hypothetical protein